MLRTKYKYIKLALVLVLLLAAAVFSKPFMPNVAADPHASCTAPATAVFPSNGDPSYCACPKGDVVDATAIPNTCAKKCPDGTVVTKQNGQTYCSGQQTCPDGSDAPSNDVNQCPDAAASAASDPAMQCAQHQNDKCDLFKKYLNPTINLLSALVGLVVVGSVIVGAIQYSASAGDPQKAAKAKGRIMNSVVALVAFIFLFAFLQWLIPGGILNK